MVVGLPEKAIQKVDKELLELHKEVLRSYLTQRNLKHRHQKKFFKIYDHYSSVRNIRRLDDIEDYVPLKDKHHVSRKSKKRNA